MPFALRRVREVGCRKRVPPLADPRRTLPAGLTKALAKRSVGVARRRRRRRAALLAVGGAVVATSMAPHDAADCLRAARMRGLLAPHQRRATRALAVHCRGDGRRIGSARAGDAVGCTRHRRTLLMQAEGGALLMLLGDEPGDEGMVPPLPSTVPPSPPPSPPGQKATPVWAARGMSPGSVTSSPSGNRFANFRNRAASSAQKVSERRIAERTTHAEAMEASDAASEGFYYYEDAEGNAGYYDGAGNYYPLDDEEGYYTAEGKRVLYVPPPQMTSPETHARIEGGQSRYANFRIQAAGSAEKVRRRREEVEPVDEPSTADEPASAPTTEPEEPEEGERATGAPPLAGNGSAKKVAATCPAQSQTEGREAHETAAVTVASAQASPLPNAKKVVDDALAEMSPSPAALSRPAAVSRFAAFRGRAARSEERSSARKTRDIGEAAVPAASAADSAPVHFEELMATPAIAAADAAALESAMAGLVAGGAIEKLEAAVAAAEDVAAVSAARAAGAGVGAAEAVVAARDSLPGHVQAPLLLPGCTAAVAGNDAASAFRASALIAAATARDGATRASAMTRGSVQEPVEWVRKLTGAGARPLALHARFDAATARETYVAAPSAVACASVSAAFVRRALFAA